MIVDAAAAVQWTERLVALSVAIAAIELLWVRQAWSQRGVFRWSTLRGDLVGAPRWLQRGCDGVFGERGFTLVLLIQLGLALALPLVSHAAVSWSLFAVTLAVSFRFRGDYNGGSDSMTLVVLLGLAVARSDSQATLIDLGTAYIAVQLVLSYVVAGAAKLRHADWRSGAALAALTALPQYRAPASVVRLFARPTIARPASWLVLGFECGFPLALVGPTWCIALVAAAMLFHLANVLVLGLNRFLFAWLAAYPALLYWCTVRAG